MLFARLSAAIVLFWLVAADYAALGIVFIFIWMYLVEMEN